MVLLTERNWEIPAVRSVKLLSFECRHKLLVCETRHTLDLRWINLSIN